MSERFRGTPTKFVLQRYRKNEEIGGEDGERLKALQDASASGGISQEELDEMHRIVRTHTDWEFEGPEFTMLGVTDPFTFMDNFEQMMGEMEDAYRNAYFLEAISLRLLALDLMLRTFVVHKTGRPIEPYSSEDKMSFGKLVKTAKKNGLPQEIVEDLWAFNERRNAGVHHFLLGRASYQDIGDAYRSADLLFERIIDATGLPRLESGTFEN